MIEFERKDKYDFNDLRKLMKLLRSPEGCPWDREQTHKSIRNDFIEETYEVIEGIDKDDPVILREELGDVLLQVVFHSDICESENGFDIEDVITDLCNKLLIRHPHVFSADPRYTGVSDSDQVLDNWNTIKMQTKGQSSLYDELEGVSKALPSLYRAEKLAKKLRKNDKPQNCEPETLNDLLNEYASNKDPEAFGRLLFALCASADKEKFNAEEALYKENERKINENR